MGEAASAPVPSALSRADAEELLFHEALLIDDRRFDEWLELFTEDAVYWVPCEPDQVDAERHVSIIYDHGPERALRVERLQHRHNWSQDPPPRVGHLVTNVLVGPDSDDSVEVRSNQLVCVARMEETTFLPTRCTHLLTVRDGAWRIASKKVVLLGADQYLTPDTITLL